MKTTGLRIKRLRERKGWTQLELAATLNINNSVLSRIESGTRPVDDELLVRLADLFGTSTDYLLGRADRINESRPAYRADRSLFEDAFLERLHRAAFYDEDRELTDEEKKIMMESLIDAAASIKKIISRTARS